MAEKTLEELSKTFAALGHPERLAILAYLLAKGGDSCTELAEKLQVSTPALSYHLKVLEETGLIVKERKGRRRCLRIGPELKNLVRPGVLAALKKEEKWSTK